MSVQSASSIGTAPSPLAWTLNEPRNFRAVDSEAARASDCPASCVTAGWFGCRVSSVSASDAVVHGRTAGKKKGVTPRGTTISQGRRRRQEAGVSDIAPT